MPRYFYRGQEVSSGRIVSGGVEAPSREAAEQQLRTQKSLKITQLTPAPVPRNGLSGPPASVPKRGRALDKATATGLFLLLLGAVYILSQFAGPQPPVTQDLRQRVKVSGHLSVPPGTALGSVQAQVHLGEIPWDEFRGGKELFASGTSKGDFCVDFEVLAPKAVTTCSLVLTSPDGALRLDRVPLSVGEDGVLQSKLDQIRLLPLQPAPQTGLLPSWQSLERAAPQRQALPAPDGRHP